MEILIKKLNKNAVIPQPATEFSGGMDLTCTSIKKVGEDLYECGIGLAMQPPFGYRIIITPRSSLTKYAFVMQNSPALGDADYTGEYILKFRALPTGIKTEQTNAYIISKYLLTYDTFPFKVGDRIAQMYVEQVLPVVFIENKPFLETKRSAGGFGSTGK